MSIEKKIVPTKQPQFQKILVEKFKTWTNIDDEEIEDALKDLCGDSFFEIRKMTAQICRCIEGQGIDTKKAEVITTALKLIIDDTWRCIIDKQKIGIDKLGIIVRKYVKED